MTLSLVDTKIIDFDYLPKSITMANIENHIVSLDDDIKIIIIGKYL